jgi:hypothetical protein
MVSTRQKIILKQLKIIKNRFGHLRADWRILRYIVFIVIFSRLADLVVNSILLMPGENLSDYALL